MKKLITLLLLCALPIIALFLGACEQKRDFSIYVSDLRENVYSNDDGTILATFGFREAPFINDGKVSEKRNRLVIKLINDDYEGDYSAQLILDGKTYESEFSINTLKGSLTAEFETVTSPPNDFTFTLKKGSDRKDITLKSQIPDSAMDYKKMLNSLASRQSDIFERFFPENSPASCEIYARIIKNEDKIYWYVGFASGNDNLKALLVNAETGEVLAIKDIF